MKGFWFHSMIRRTATLVVILGGLVSATDVLAQEGWEKENEGEIKDVQYEIIVNKKVTLPRASRNFEKVSPRPFEAIQPAIRYEAKNFRFATPDFKPVIRPLKLKAEELSKIYGNYLSAGAGNYSSFFLEGSLTTKRDKSRYLGVHVYNRSFGAGPLVDKNSASSTLAIQAFGKAAGKVITFSGEGNFENRGTYFYGYDPVTEIDREKIRQTYDIYSVKAGIENTKVGDFNYTLKAGYSYLMDHYNAREGELSMQFTSSYSVNETNKILVTADYFNISRTDLNYSTDPRHLFKAKPAYRFAAVQDLILTVGANAVFQNDQYAGSKDFHFYPDLKAQYALSPSIEVYGTVTGDIDKVTLHTISAENLWVKTNQPLYHTNRLELKGGINGKVGKKVAFGVGFSVAELKNLYNYLNNPDSLNPANIQLGTGVDRMLVAYESNTKRINPYADISYSHADAFRFTLRGDLFAYSTSDLRDTYNRPTWRINASARTNLYDKISLEAGIMAQGGAKALEVFNYKPNEFIDLDAAIDVNAKARYFLSKQFSAFVQMNNLMSTNYPIYLNYPARGFQVLAGVSWSF
jgi:hypothetical protein